MALWPSGLAEAPDATGHFVAEPTPRRHRPGQYEPDDNPAAWPLTGPCTDFCAQ
ncbi:MAG TPA: hypothetical protein VGH27_29895 [Streptosporangiaceae bacterium]